jgi:hypothetical protein
VGDSGVVTVNGLDLVYNILTGDSIPLLTTIAENAILNVNNVAVKV